MRLISMDKNRKRKSFSRSLWSVILVVDLSCRAFVALRYIHSMHFVEHFCREWMLNFVKYFLCIYLDDHLSVFHFVHVVCHID